MLARNEGRAEVDALAKEKRELRALIQQLEAERGKTEFIKTTTKKIKRYMEKPV